jgi:hypothetical protein
MEDIIQGFRGDLPASHTAQYSGREGSLCLLSGAPLLGEITQTSLTHCNKNGYQEMNLAGIVGAFTNP